MLFDSRRPRDHVESFPILYTGEYIPWLDENSCQSGLTTPSRSTIISLGARGGQQFTLIKAIFLFVHLC
jgi:hypothetical protein